MARHTTPASFGRLLGRSPHATRAGLLNNAEIIVWQSSRRLVMALGLGVAAALLRATHVIAGPAWPIFVIVPAYIALVALLTLRIERRHRVGRAALFVLALADVVAIFTVVALVTPAAFYVRGLLLSLLVLQFTQMFFGRTPALTVVVGSTLGYAVLLGLAHARGVSIAWAEQGWLVALYLLVALNGMALQASANRRLASLVELFGNAQRGDFSRTFVDERDREPDGITLLGRAYNHLRSELATMVLTDPLTQCFNRRGFEQVLMQTVAAAVRRGGELALLAIDIDHFKAINDSAGHLAGDAVLREIAELLTQSSRVGDVVARVGGEEFVILLPNADSETAGVVAERVMATVRAHQFRGARGHRDVTVSIGIASEQVIDPHVGGALRARADEALYVAKRLGRNRVVMWAPGIRSNATPPWPGYATIE
ncbi:MAG TPA: GGDEF domain-containing protein [Gemmatimonadaceae bacterium]|nr:GGDEF domain-containing protein [Gemmatimonadaceae bacterium]